MIILASNSETRLKILQNAGVELTPVPPRLDENMIKATLLAGGASARDIVDALAEAKSRKTSMKLDEALVLGCDQVLEFEGNLLSKVSNRGELFKQLKLLREKKHKLYSAAVIYLRAEPIWRHIGEVQIQMRDYSDEFLEEYLDRNFDEVKHCVGGYQIEGAGAQLITEYRGDYFSILGLPLLPILQFLRVRGVLPS